MSFKRVDRPWGYFTILYKDPGIWLKEIVIHPGQSLSYQTHEHRMEVWLTENTGAHAIVAGEAFALEVGVPVTVKAGVPHRLYNPGQSTVSVIELAYGHPDEDDIIRISDQYGR